MPNGNFIKLYRQILDNPVVCKDGDHFAVWVYLLLKATHTEHEHWFRKKRITLMPGQFTTARSLIASDLNISESKVQRILKLLENEQQIEQQMSSEKRLITVKNWSKYQGCEQRIEQQVNSEWTASEQRVNIQQEGKKEKKERRKEKDIYGEFVSLAESEYKKLVDAHGETATKRMIEILDNYKGAKGVKYDSDYRAILNWVVKRYQEEAKTDIPKEYQWGRSNGN